MADDPPAPEGRIANVANAALIEAAKPRVPRAKPVRSGKRGRPPHVDQATRDEIRRHYRDRMTAWGWADAMMRDPAVRERRKLLARMGEMLALFAGPVTEADALAMTPEERERRWAKLPSRYREAFEKTPELKVTVQYRRAKGYGARIIKELADEYKLSANLVRHIVKSHDPIGSSKYREERPAEDASLRQERANLIARCREAERLAALCRDVRLYPHCTPEIAEQAIASFWEIGIRAAAGRGISEELWMWKRSRWLAGYK